MFLDSQLEQMALNKHTGVRFWEKPQTFTQARFRS
jgi:hypothetical protein